MKSVLGLEVKDQAEADAHLIIQKMYFQDDGCDRTPEALVGLVGIGPRRVCDALEAFNRFFRIQKGGLDGPDVKYYGLNLEGLDFIRKSFVTKECPHCGTHLVCQDCGTVVE